MRRAVCFRHGEQHFGRAGERMQNSEDGSVEEKVSSRPLRILFISQYFWPENFRANDIALGLKERGCEVTVVTGLPNYPRGQFFDGYTLARGPYTDRWNGLRVLRLPMFARGQGNRFKLALNYLSFAALGSLIIPFRLTRSSHDVVLCWMVSPITQVLPAIVAKRYVRSPLVLWVMDLWPDSLSASGQVKHAAIIGAAGRLTRWIYRRCDRILGQSKRFSEHIARVGGLAPQSIGYMPQWEPSEAPITASVIPPMPEGFKVMFTGNIGFSQDFETIIAAARILRDDTRIHWHIVGDGHALPSLRKQIQESDLGARVHVWGRYPADAMSAFYREADVLLATLRAEDAFTRTIPTKIQAYLASGKPIVTAIDGEVAEVIANSGAGFPAHAGDPSSLAQAVRAMADLSPTQREQMGARGKAYYMAHFDREMLLTRLLDFLQDAAQNSRSTRVKA